MILQELRSLAERENLIDDPDFQPKTVRWIISIGPDGRFLGVSETQGQVSAPDNPKAKPKKPKPKVYQVPRQPDRTSGQFTYFLVDKADYVLGFDPDDAPNKREKLDNARRLFIERIEIASSIVPEEPSLKAVLSFLNNDEERKKCIEQIRSSAESNNLFMFLYFDSSEDESSLVHERPRVKIAWKRMSQMGRQSGGVKNRAKNGGQKRSKSDANSEEFEALSSQCLICGNNAPPVDKHPQIKKIPGGSTSGVALVCFNSKAFESHGFDGNQNAPVCESCAIQYTTALNRLFDSNYVDPQGKVLPRRNIKLSSDTSVVFWASKESEFANEFGALEPEDASKIEDLYRSLHHGKRYILDDPALFHALVVTGGKGRAVLRGYHQSTVSEVANSIISFLDDIDLVPRHPGAPRYPKMSWLVRSLAAQGKLENVPPNIAGEFFLAILSGPNSIIPRSILMKAVERIHTEPDNPDRNQHKHTRERVALVRISLNRLFRSGDQFLRSLIQQEIPPMLDPSCRNNAYCLGRLFAVLEKLQGESVGAVNATITDRFYGAASATPAAVFGSLLRKAQHHLAKMNGPFYDKKIQEILILLDPENAFPSTLGLDQQGLFALGYYQQRHDLWTSKADKSAQVVDQTESASIA